MQNNKINISNNKPVLLILLGPTGVGKTEISLKLAEQFNAPIVSSDSRQFYRELKIGTAAPTEEQLQRVKHYFIGTHSIFDKYSAGQYETDAVKLLDELFKVHPVVMLVGGSMMYIDAICKGIDDIPHVSPEIRNFWLQKYHEKGLDFLLEELKKRDPKHYDIVDKQNYKRVIHAVEVSAMTGKPYSDLLTGTQKKRNFDILKIGLNRERGELYERINLRVDEMVKAGLIEEAMRYYPHKTLNSLNTVGYKELYKHMDGDWTLDFAIEKIKAHSRQYARRQLTWFNGDKNVHWFHPEAEDEIVSFVTNAIKS